MKDGIEELLEEEKEKAAEKGIKVTKMILSGKHKSDRIKCSHLSFLAREDEVKCLHSLMIIME